MRYPRKAYSVGSPMGARPMTSICSPSRMPISINLQAKGSSPTISSTMADCPGDSSDRVKGLPQLFTSRGDENLSLLIQSETQTTALDTDHTWRAWADHANIATYMHANLLQPFQVTGISAHINDDPVVFRVKQIERNWVCCHKEVAKVKGFPTTYLNYT